MKKFVFSGIVLGLILVSFIPQASAEHIFESRQAFGQYLDTIKSSSEKYDVIVGEQTFEIHYGYEGSMEADIEELLTRIDPKLVSMELDIETKALKVVLEPAPKSSTFWLLLPIDFLSAENEKYQLFIDGKETRYDLTKFPTAYALGMIVPPEATQVEIIGTNVVPEFGSVAVMVLAVSILGVVYFVRKSKLLPKY